MEIKEFGVYLRELRRKQGITLAKLAVDTDLSQPYLSQIETGKIKKMVIPETLKKLSEALKVDYSLLLNKAGYTDLSLANSIKESDEDFYKQLEDLQNMNTLLKLELEKYTDIENYFSVLTGRTTLWTNRKGKIREYYDYTFKPKYKGIILTDKENEFILKTIESLISLRGEN
ncbi:helix-turn-helix domain-containing protein [Arthrobacter citreus]|nr:helix-turn-helix domain-containing protein [Arthrobacter citreus]